MEVMMDMVWSGFITGIVPARHTVNTCNRIITIQAYFLTFFGFFGVQCKEKTVDSNSLILPRRRISPPRPAERGWGREGTAGWWAGRRTPGTPAQQQPTVDI